MKRQLSSVLGIASVILAVAGSAVAADYPDRPITLIVPYGAGGGTDYTGASSASCSRTSWGRR